MRDEEEWKYVYSTPDDREYLMFRGAGEGPGCDANECVDRMEGGEPADPLARAALERLRGALVARFKRDGYTQALDESGHASALARHAPDPLGAAGRDGDA